MRAKPILFVLIAFLLLAAACGSDTESGATDDASGASTTAGDADTSTTAGDADTSTTAGDGATDAEPSGDNPLGALRVPQDFDTIQAAVDAAADGDLVLIDEGVYNEAVVVETDNIVIRGVDRNTVILDGEHDLENGLKVFSNGVAVENLTARNFTSNGVFFTGSYEDSIILNGYRASYVTVHNNGDYGIYAFNAENGLFEHSYGSGHPDSAFYIGQCQPCNTVITDGLAENNALGYSGTNAGGDLYIINSEWRNNRIGIVPNSLNSEELAPQRNATFAGNWVHDNGNEETPRKGSDWDLAFGVGIVVAGGENDLITKNLAENNASGGIAIATFPDGDTFWQPNDNRVIDNVAMGNPIDLVFFSIGENSGNCFEGNTFETSQPADIETNVPCDAEYVDISDQYTPADPESFSVIDYIDVPAPGPQESMPDALTRASRTGHRCVRGARRRRHHRAGGRLSAPIRRRSTAAVVAAVGLAAVLFALSSGCSGRGQAETGAPPTTPATAADDAAATVLVVPDGPRLSERLSPRLGGQTTAFEEGEQAFNIPARNLGLPDDHRFVEANVVFERNFRESEGLGPRFERVQLHRMSCEQRPQPDRGRGRGPR